MKQTLIINDTLTDLNTYINAERRNKFMAAKIKKEETERVYWLCRKQGLKPFTKPVAVKITWIDNSRKDPDNICYSKKYLLDGMVMAGVLKNDGKRQIVSFFDTFTSGDHEQIIVEVEEVQ